MVNLMHDRLLAKSYHGGQVPPWSCTLLGHLQNVHAASTAFIAATGESMLSAFGLPKTELGRIRRIVAFAAAVHDVGKANSHFLGMLLRSPDRASHHYRQALRHEWVTWWWLNMPYIREWAVNTLESTNDFYIALCCVAGHHPSARHPTPPEHVEGAGSEMDFFAGYNEFESIREWLNREFSSPTLLPISANVQLRCAQAVSGDVISRIHRQVNTVQAHIDALEWPQLSEWQLYCACAKACLIAADVAGSALAEQKHHLHTTAEWISDTLNQCPDPESIEEMAKERLNGAPERPFQALVASSTSRVTLVTAGCGSGKTIAAWLWTARQCPWKRVFFCYPTTGTATEGFRGYLFDEHIATSKLGAKLLHSRASVDFDIILNAIEDADDTELRIASLRAWQTPIVCCTVDTVLGVMQNQRRGLYAWPSISQSAFVFDEIHAYDDKLFGCLLQFLEKLKGLRILLMTASLPTVRLNAIREVLLEQGDDLHVIGGPRNLEELPRYHQCSADDMEERIRAEVQAGGRVLWICNVVQRAMEAADQFADLNPWIYHSRFRYQDRVEQHRAVVHAFDQKSTSRGCLAICTQVAEMSLDISATLLVSEMCPVPSLIQRLGRLNRHAHPPGPTELIPPTSPFVVFEPLNHSGDFQAMPYAPAAHGDWMKRTRLWLNLIGRADISQSTLAAAWEELGANDPAPARSSSTWIEGGPLTIVDSVRESSPSITAVMAGEDANRVANRSSELLRLGIPMPIPYHYPDWKSWRAVGGYLVAPDGTIDYRKNRGAQWL